MFFKSAILCAAFFLAACASTDHPQASAPQPVQNVHPHVPIVQIAPGVWMHTSTRRYPGGVLVPSNGLIVEDTQTATLIDTAWDNPQTEEIYAWAKFELHKPITRAIVTHAHDDRIGGVASLQNHGVIVSGLEMTRNIAAKNNVAGPDDVFRLEIGESRMIGRCEIFYPGEGHAKDNLVVWIADASLLYGGCLIKSAEAADLGNVGDANLLHWPAAVELARDRFPRARIVVPGHGTVGGIDLLSHTVTLLAKSTAATRPADGELLK